MSHSDTSFTSSHSSAVACGDIQCAEESCSMSAFFCIVPVLSCEWGIWCEWDICVLCALWVTGVYPVQKNASQRIAVWTSTTFSNQYQYPCGAPWNLSPCCKRNLEFCTIFRWSRVSLAFRPALCHSGGKHSLLLWHLIVEQHGIEPYVRRGQC